MNNIIHTLYFNKPVSFTNQVGARFYNVTTKSFAVASYSKTSLPSKLVTYLVEWTVLPQQGDKIEWIYNGKGNYRDVNHRPMGMQRLVMINCCDADSDDAKALEVVDEQTDDRSTMLINQIRRANN